MNTNKYQIWLEGDGTKFQLPVNPEIIKMSQNGANESITIANLGESTLIQKPKALVISFSSFFPAIYFSGCNPKKIAIPHYYIYGFLGWQQRKIPIKLYITGCAIAQNVTIESFQYSQSGGDVGTYDYSVTLKQYTPIKIAQINVNNIKKTASITKTSARVSTQIKPKTYTVKNGDSLFNIAKKYYGDGSQLTKIYNANKNIIGANPNLIKAGTVLSIP